MAPLLFCLGMACSVDREGISVGNPSFSRVTTAVSSEVTLTSGRGRLFGVAVEDDEGNVFRTQVNEGIDILGDEELAIPRGAWRRVTLNFVGDFRYRGHLADGEPFEFLLDAPQVRLTPDDVEVEVADEGYVVELAFPDWLDLENTEVPLTEASEPGSPLHGRLTRVVEDASALYVDTDDDGRVSGNERSRRAAAGQDRRQP
jgi:hypothetical protein